MPDMSSTDTLTTVEAARLLDRPDTTIRAAIAAGRLQATRDADYSWRVTREDVERWDAATRRRPEIRGRRKDLGKPVLELLGRYESLTADELAQLLQLHPGNARKRFALLNVAGLVERNEVGEWMLTPAGQNAVKEIAAA